MVPCAVTILPSPWKAACGGDAGLRLGSDRLGSHSIAIRMREKPDPISISGVEFLVELLEHKSKMFH